MTSSMRGKRRSGAPVKLPGAHRVVFEKAGGRVAIYWYRRRGQTPAMIIFQGEHLGAALKAERDGAQDLVAAYHQARTLPDPITVKDLVTRYKAAPNGWGRVADSTRATWSPWLDAITDQFGDLPNRALSAKGVRTAIIEWRDTFQATPRAADTGMQVINRLFNWALDRELIEKNPAAGIEGIYTTNRATIIVTEDELTAVLKHATKAGRLAIRLAAATGMRRGDLIDLRWNEVGDFHIEREANKSSTGKRLVVPLIQEARDVLAELRAMNKAAELSTLHVLRSSRGPWQKDGLGVTWWKAATKAGIAGDKHFNDLRGTACTRFYMTIDKVTDEEMADLMGWEVEHCRAIRKRYVDASRIARGIVARIERAETAK